VEVALTAAFYGLSKGKLDSLVLLSAGSDWRFGIGFAPKRSANASIECAGPVGGDSYHSAKGSDR